MSITSRVDPAHGSVTRISPGTGDNGDTPGGVYLVMSGRVRITRDTVDGDEITVDLAAPGDVVLMSPDCASYDMFSTYLQPARAFITTDKRRPKPYPLMTKPRGRKKHRTQRMRERTDASSSHPIEALTISAPCRMDTPPVRAEIGPARMSDRHSPSIHRHRRRAYVTDAIATTYERQCHSVQTPFMSIRHQFLVSISHCLIIPFIISS